MLVDLTGRLVLKTLMLDEKKYIDLIKRLKIFKNINKNVLIKPTNSSKQLSQCMIDKTLSSIISCSKCFFDDPISKTESKGLGGCLW